MTPAPLFAQWFDRLKRQRPPAMAPTRAAVAALLDRPATRHAELEQALADDPGLMVALFASFANQLKPPREPTCTATHAIALQGLAPLFDAVTNLPVAGREHPAWSLGLAPCYARAAHAARYAHDWGVARGDPQPRELAVAALLHDCAEMALWCEAPRVMARLVSVAPGEARDRSARKLLGGTLAEFGRALADAWFLPPLVAESLTPAGACQPRSLGVMLAAALARASAASWYSATTGELVELAAEYLELSADAGAARMHALSAEVARALAGLPLVPAAGTLLHPPPPAAPEPEPAAGPVPRPVPDAAAAEREPAPAPMPVKPRAKGEGERSRLPADLAKLPLQVPMSEALRSLQRELGLERCMFAMLTGDGGQLRARFVLGAGQASPLRGFRVPLAERSLFSLLMSKPQGFWLNPGNRAKFLPLIPQQTRNVLGDGDFFISSLFVAGQPLGLLYASGGKLDAERFSGFKSRGQQLAKTLARAG